MKVFWYQCGLHIEPESDEEQAALCLLLHSTRFTSIAASKPDEPAEFFSTSDKPSDLLKAASEFSEHLPKIIITDHQIAPGESTRGVE